jgi:hypothetical protein
MSRPPISVIRRGVQLTDGLRSVATPKQVLERA